MCWIVFLTLCCLLLVNEPDEYRHFPVHTEMNGVDTTFQKGEILIDYLKTWREDRGGSGKFVKYFC